MRKARVPNTQESAQKRPVVVGDGLASTKMRVVAFSDYRVQDIALLTEEISKLDPKPDIILYAGDDVDRFRPSKSENLFQELAKISRCGVCAVIGNDDFPQHATFITGRRVYDLHSAPVIVGNYAILGLEGSSSPPGRVIYSEAEIFKTLSQAASPHWLERAHNC